ncbi:MAG: hypothetical protein WA731_05535 [Pseudonocardiaceae bacterium]
MSLPLFERALQLRHGVLGEEHPPHPDLGQPPRRRPAGTRPARGSPPLDEDTETRRRASGN